MTSAYQLVVDSGSQDIDIVLSGAPVIQSEVIAPDSTSVLQVAEEAGFIVLGIVAGEAIPYMLDKLTGYFTSAVGATPQNLYAPTLRFMGAERQLRETNEPVTFGIGGGRQITLSSSVVDRATGNALLPEYVNALTLDPVYPGNRKSAAGASGSGNIELTNQNISQIAPINADESNIDEPGQAEPGSRPNNGDSLSIENDVAGQVLERVWNAVRAYQPAREALVTALEKAGFLYCGRLPTLSNIDAAFLATFRLSYEQTAALYSGCITYTIAAAKAGTVTGGLYGSIASNIPLATCNPDTAARVAQLPGITGYDANGNNAVGVSITTTPGGNITYAQPGLFSDLASAADSGNTDLSQLLIHDIIRRAPRPLGVKLAAVAIYVAGALLGTGAGFLLDDAKDAVVSGDDEGASDAAANQIESASKKSPSSLLFSAVSFPFMERFVSGGVNGPTPASVLQCASVNGGLICGVNIPVNLN